MSARVGEPQLISAADFASASLPEAPKEIIGDGQIAIVAAQYGRGKTPLFAHAALEAACSIALTPLGLNSCSGPVLVLDGESNPSLYRAMFARLMHSAAVEQWPQNLHFWFKLDQKLTPGNASFDALARLVAKFQPSLLVPDPLRQFSSGYDLTKPKDALTFMNSLRSLQSEAPKLRIALPHHLTKRDLNSDSGALADDPWAWLERVSGSLALLDHADVRLGFEEENGKLVMAGIKRGVGIVGPWHFEVENDGLGQPCRYRFEDRERSVHARYVAFLQKLPDSYTWQAGRVSLGISDSTMHRFTKAVTEAGLVSQGIDKLYRKVEVRK
jgi:hypothetical protein